MSETGWLLTFHCRWRHQQRPRNALAVFLFRHTPPTAILLDAVSLFHAARDHLAKKGIVAPRHVSLVCDDLDSSFEWMQPSVARIHWSFEPLARRVAQWLEHVAAGKDDRRQTLLKVKFVDCGTIGPVTKA